MHSWELLDSYAKHDSRWFESSNRYNPAREYLELFQEIMPDTWSLRRSGTWFVAEPPDPDMPDQGWKLHLSISTKDALSALQKALPILRDEAVCFKFLLDRVLTASVNSKLWPREASGKFITIYPRSMDQFYRLGHYLAHEMREFVGPYILSDRRWPDSKCVYYRYGGFRSRSILRVDGLRTQCITNPNGQLVKDLRLPYWSPPEWVEDPFAADNVTNEFSNKGLYDGRFTIKSVVRFTNRGGVYLAQDNQDGQEVILKEFRPHVEVGRHAIDAISVGEKEYRLLQKLSDTGYFVQPVAFFVEWEHTFLAERFVFGEHLGRFTIRRNPLYRHRLDAAAVSDYLQTMRGLWLQLAHAIRTAHERNIILGDLSFGNVIVRDETEIAILDLESGAEEEVDPTVGLFTPGYSSPFSTQVGVNDRTNDYYALGALIFGSLLIANGTIAIHRPARRRFLDTLSTDLALPNELVELVEDLFDANPTVSIDSEQITTRIAQLPIAASTTCNRTPRLEQPVSERFTSEIRANLRPQVAEVVAGVNRYLVGTADLSRNDRLFPADPYVFETNPLSVSYGAAGVLYSLQCMGGIVPPELVAWMLRVPISDEYYPPGLYIGQAGIAWVLDDLGYEEIAVRLMRSSRSHPLLFDAANVLHGAAGFGLACLRFWKRGAGQDFLDDAVRIGDWLLGSGIDDEQGVRWPNKRDERVHIGYALGGSGVALFLLYLHLVTGDTKYLTCGRRALDFDLGNAKWVDDRFVGFPPEPVETATVFSPYWLDGTAGVATTLIRYLVALPDSDLGKWRGILEADVSHKYAAFPQLFRGLAGLGNYMIDAWQFTGEEGLLAEAWQIAEGILLYRMERIEGITFPGEQALRESADFATGASGVALFLNRLLGTERDEQENFNFVVDDLLPLERKSA
jgi:serine/threonine protein kinase